MKLLFIKQYGWGRCLLWLGLFSLIVLVFFWQLGSFPLLDADEPRYAQTAQEMLHRGDWITPYFNGSVRFDKPVFFYWMIASAYQWFGVSEWSARLFSALAASGITIGMVGCLQLLGFGAVAWLSALVLISSLEFVLLGRMSITDMTLAFWVSTTLLAAYMALERTTKIPLWWLLCGICAGFGLLTKGPVALALPTGIIAVYTLITGQFIRKLVTSRWPWLALLLSLLVALPWYIACYQANGWPFVDALLLHNVTRFEGVVSGHRQPWFFYGLVLLAGFMPWTGFIPAIGRGWWQTIRQPITENNRLLTYTAVWAVGVFLFFSAAQTKLLTYILPIYPPLAIALPLVWLKKPSSRLIKAGTTATVILAVLANIIFNINLTRLFPREMTQLTHDPGLHFMGLPWLLGSSVGLWWLIKQQSQKSLISLAIGFMGMLFLINTILLPAIVEMAEAPVTAVRLWRKTLGPLPVMTYGMQRSSLTFYLDEPVHTYNTIARLQSAINAAGKDGALILTKQQYTRPLQTQLPCYPQQFVTGYVILKCQ